MATERQPPHGFASREQVERRLGELGCYWADNIDDHTQRWMTAFGFSFTVPIVEPHNDCPTLALNDIVEEIRRLKMRK